MHICFAQERYRLKSYDERKLHYGFFVGGNMTSFTVRNADNFPSNGDPVVTINPKASPGFSLGFVADLNLADYWDMRVAPTAGFYERVLEYDVAGEKVDKIVEGTVLELPILFKYKAERRKNSRMYMLAGAAPVFSIAQKQDADKDLVRNKSFDVEVQVGFGLDLFYSLIKFSPEIRFSHGVTNVLAPDNNEFSNRLQRLYTNKIGLYLVFQ